MLEELTTKTFELDYELYEAIDFKFNKFSEQIYTPQLKSDDMLKEFEDYIAFTSKLFEELLQLLNQCNDQRKNLRVMLVNLLKKKMLVDKFFKEEDNALMLHKLYIHDEVKNKVIDRNNMKICQQDEIIRSLVNKLSSLKREELRNQQKLSPCKKKPIKQSHAKNNGKMSNTKNVKSNKNSTVENSSNNSTLSSIRKTSTHKENLSINYNNLNMTFNQSMYSNKNAREKNTDSPIECSINTSQHLINDSHNDSVLNKMLNLDFNNEQYNIISSSPIHDINANPQPSQQNRSRGFKSNSMVVSPQTEKALLQSRRFNPTEGLDYQDNGASQPKRLSRSIELDYSYDYFTCQTQGEQPTCKNYAALLQAKNLQTEPALESDERDPEEFQYYQPPTAIGKSHVNLRNQRADSKFRKQNNSDIENMNQRKLNSSYKEGRLKMRTISQEKNIKNSINKPNPGGSQSYKKGNLKSIVNLSKDGPSNTSRKLNLNSSAKNEKIKSRIGSKYL